MSRHRAYDVNDGFVRERARGWFDSNGNFTLEEEDTREAWLKEYEDNNRSEVAIRQSDQQVRALLSSDTTVTIGTVCPESTRR